MASDLKYTSFFKTGRSFFWKLSCLVVKRRLYVGYGLLVFAFQMRNRLKYKQRKNKVLKEILISATLQSHYVLHLMKSAFASRHFSCFDNVSQEFCILLFGFCFFWFLSIGAWVKVPREWIRIALWLHGLWLSSVCTFFMHPHRKKKYIKKLSNILLTDPQLTWGGNLTDFNFLRSISTFCTHKKIKLSAALSQWACWKFCNLPSLWYEVHNLIPVHRITPFCSEALVSSPNLVLPACSLALVDNYN